MPSSKAIPTEAMIEAGLEAWDIANAAMILRDGSDTPQKLPDYDQGDICRAIYTAMEAARVTSMEEGDAERVAKLFHDTYERLAPQFSYETREASAKPWKDVPENNRKLMIATVGEVLAALSKPSTDAGGLVEAEDWFYLFKWIERGLFCSHTDAKTALECIAFYPSAPWNNGRWDVDHKPYAAKFYATFPKAAALATQADRLSLEEEKK